MRITLRICRILMWVAFIWTLLAQIVAMIGIKTYSAFFNISEMIISLVVLTVGMLLFTVLKNKRLIGLIIATVSLVFCVIAAVKISETFVTGIDVAGGEFGISGFKLVFRHLTNFIVWICMIIIWLIERFKRQQAERIASGAYTGHYDLSGETLFSDKMQDTRHVKRSVRAKQKQDELES